MLLTDLRNALFRVTRSCHSVTSRHLQTSASLRPVPLPRGSIQNASDFLTAIGRSCENKLGVTGWEELWNMRGLDMKKTGLNIKDRRYILWSMEKYRQGQDPSIFAHEARPPKKIRGWGPSVQFGKRIRSRRHR